MGRVLAFEHISPGTIAPDLLAGVAVFVALYVRRPIDAVIAACVLGFALDLTTTGAGGLAGVIGPMPIAYVLGTAALVAVREAFFAERISTRMLLTLAFCLFAHWFWVTLQSLLAHEVSSWSEYGRMLMQVIGVSVYSALLAPVIMWLLDKVRGWILAAPISLSRRSRR